MHIAEVEVGKTGLHINNMGFGGAALGNTYTSVSDDIATELIQAAVENNLRYFDTAPCYGFGLSETRLGAALSTLPRDQIRIASKVGYDLVPAEQPVAAIWQDAPPLKAVHDFSYDGAMRSIEASLKRLNTDHIDMLAIHDPDEAAGATPYNDRKAGNHFEEAMKGSYRALTELRDQGVVAAIGVGITQWEMLVDFASGGDFDYFLLAGRYTLLEEDSARILLPLCLERGISVIIGGPYNSGILATGAVPDAYYNYGSTSEAVLNRVRKIEAVCARHGVSLRAAALQFPLRHPAVVSVIPGMRSITELNENRTAFNEGIGDDLWAELRFEKLVVDMVEIFPD